MARVAGESFKFTWFLQLAIVPSEQTAYDLKIVATTLKESNLLFASRGLGEGNMTVLGTATGVVLSLTEPITLGPNIPLGPGLYRGVRTVWPNVAEPEYKLQLSTSRREQEFDVTALVKSGVIIER